MIRQQNKTISDFLREEDKTTTCWRCSSILERNMVYKSQAYMHKQDGEWIDKEKEKIPSEKQNTVKITKDDVKRKLKSTSDWKGAVPDKIQSFWSKSFTYSCTWSPSYSFEWMYRSGGCPRMVGWIKNCSSGKRLQEGYWSGELQTTCLPQLDMEASDRNHYWWDIWSFTEIQLLPEAQKRNRRKY